MLPCLLSLLEVSSYYPFLGRSPAEVQGDRRGSPAGRPWEEAGKGLVRARASLPGASPEGPPQGKRQGNIIALEGLILYFFITMNTC